MSEQFPEDGWPAEQALQKRDGGPEVHVVTGIAGAGKTAYAMGLLELELRQGRRPTQVGFLSFSRAACAEAVSRAAKICEMSEDALTRQGWFRTIHSACARGLGTDPKKILDPDAKHTKQFYLDCLGSERGGDEGTLAWRIARVLDQWDLARQRLWPVLSRQSEAPGTDGPDTWDTSGHLGTLEMREVSGAENPAKDSGFEPDSPGGTPLSYIYRHDQNQNRSAVDRSSSVPTVPSLSKPIYIQELRRDGSQDGKCPDVSLPSEEKEHWCTGLDDCAWANQLVEDFERGKRLFGFCDFVDLLVKYAALAYRNGELTPAYPEGRDVDTVAVWFIDEAQDNSPLLWRAADRLVMHAEKVYVLGDPYQSVYGFLGASPDELLKRQIEARQRGCWELLNRSWRNPPEVLEWGEAILREDPQYEERNPVSESGEGSVGLIEWPLLRKRIPVIGNHDVLIVGRTWYSLEQVTRSLSEHGIPWSSVAEKHSSPWDAPARLAYVLTMRALEKGDKISEQDWRRVLDNLPQKIGQEELFTRGTKAKWKKLECSGVLEKTLDQVADWGALPAFHTVVRNRAWCQGPHAVVDYAIDRWGEDIVRKPSVRIGTVHSVKGMEADIVLCMALSTAASEKANPAETLNLRYVAVTRARQHYRLVIDPADVYKGKPLFWAAPKSEKHYDQSLDFLTERVVDPKRNPEPADQEEHLALQSSPDSTEQVWNTGRDRLLQGPVSGSGSEAAGTSADSTAKQGTQPDIEEWWSL